MISSEVKSTKDLQGTDTYAEDQAITQRKDTYEYYGEQMQPETFLESNEGKYKWANAFRHVFPFLSGLTLISLVIFIGVPVNQIRMEGIQSLTLLQWGMSILTVVGAVGLVMVIEKVKQKSLWQYFKAIVKKDKPHAIIT